MKKVTPNFKGLTSTQFEEFCFELIGEMGFKNVDWLKGTPSSTSTSDRGRDIEADYHREDIDKTHVVEKWMFDSKHYNAAVPPAALQDSLAWAAANRPSKLVFISSGYFSNPCKDFVEEYKKNNKPTFEIRLWELKDIERFTIGLERLLVRHNVAIFENIESFIHPVHLSLMTSMIMFDLSSFLQTMDSVDKKKRDEAFAIGYHSIIQPRYREAIRPDDTMQSLMLDRVDYDAFREKMIEAARKISGSALVCSTVFQALTYTFHLGNPLNVEVTKKRNSELLEILERDGNASEKLTKIVKASVEQADERSKEFRSLYEWVCEKIVQPTIAKSELEISARTSSHMRTVRNKLEE